MKSRFEVGEYVQYTQYRWAKATIHTGKVTHVWINAEPGVHRLTVEDAEGVEHVIYSDRRSLKRLQGV